MGAIEKIHRREWDDEDEEDGEDIDFIVPQSLTDVVIAEAWESGFDAAKKCLSAMGVKGRNSPNDTSNESHWWESPTGLDIRNEVHEKQMRHNAERKRNGEDTTGEDDMCSDAMPRTRQAT
jgi:hypothetical protein